MRLVPSSQVWAVKCISLHLKSCLYKPTSLFTDIFLWLQLHFRFSSTILSLSFPTQTQTMHTPLWVFQSLDVHLASCTAESQMIVNDAHRIASIPLCRYKSLFIRYAPDRVATPGAVLSGQALSRNTHILSSRYTPSGVCFELGRCDALPKRIVDCSLVRIHILLCSNIEETAITRTRRLVVLKQAPTLCCFYRY